MQRHVQIAHEMDQEFESFDPLSPPNGAITDHAGKLLDLLHDAIVVPAIPASVVAGGIRWDLNDVPVVGLGSPTVPDVVCPARNGGHFVRARAEQSPHVGFRLLGEIVTCDLRNGGMSGFAPCEASRRRGEEKQQS